MQFRVTEDDCEPTAVITQRKEWEEAIDEEIEFEGWEALSTKKVITIGYQKSESTCKVAFTSRHSVLEDNIGEYKGEEKIGVLHSIN